MSRLLTSSALISGLLLYSSSTMAACGGTPPQQWIQILDGFEASNRALLDLNPQGGSDLTLAFTVIAQTRNSALPNLVSVGRSGNKKQRDSSILGLAQAVAACRVARNITQVDMIFRAVSIYGDRDYRADLLKATGDQNGGAAQRVGVPAPDLPGPAKGLGDPLKGIKPIPALHSTTERL